MVGISDNMTCAVFSGATALTTMKAIQNEIALINSFLAVSDGGGKLKQKTKLNEALHT